MRNTFVWSEMNGSTRFSHDWLLESWRLFDNKDYGGGAVSFLRRVRTRRKKWVQCGFGGYQMEGWVREGKKVDYFYYKR